jgi:uncharacterized damage-inducible protein DinB
MNGLVAQNVELIDQALALLGQLEEAPADGRFATVAPHFRHCIDFYDCFLRGLDLHSVDYDERQRSPEMEAAPAAAAAALVRVRGRLVELDDDAPSEPLRVRGDVDGEDTPWSQSTVGRELLFLLSHTVHHHALIALLLERHGATAPADFGMAPSTLRHARR